MELKTIELLDPTVQPKARETIAAPHIPELHGGIRLLFLWNSKPNGDILLSYIRDSLSQKFQLAATGWYQKDRASAPADAAIINELAAKSDLVIMATAD